VKLCHVNISGPVFLRHTVYICLLEALFATMRYSDVYVGNKVRVAKFMMSWNLQLNSSK